MAAVAVGVLLTVGAERPLRSWKRVWPDGGWPKIDCWLDPSDWAWLTPSDCDHAAADEPADLVSVRVHVV